LKLGTSSNHQGTYTLQAGPENSAGLFTVYRC